MVQRIQTRRLVVANTRALISQKPSPIAAHRGLFNLLGIGCGQLVFAANLRWAHSAALSAELSPSISSSDSVLKLADGAAERLDWPDGEPASDTDPRNCRTIPAFVPGSESRRPSGCALRAVGRLGEWIGGKQGGFPPSLRRALPLIGHKPSVFQSAAAHGAGNSFPCAATKFSA
jgi:hypothetical protein